MEFKVPPEKDHAIGKGSIDIRGSNFPINPWRSAREGSEHTWWYHVKVTMENVPFEAWNADSVRLILGNAYILDRLDSRTLARDSTNFLTF